MFLCIKVKNHTNIWKLPNGRLKLPKAGWVRIRQHRKIEEGYQLKGATITQEADERYYVALLYSCAEPVNEIEKAESAIGLDFSMKELYVDSNGSGRKRSNQYMQRRDSNIRNDAWYRKENFLIFATKIPTISF